MKKQNKYKYYYIDNNVIFFTLSLVAGVFITLLLYDFIGSDESNRIMSKDMIIAIKKYNIDMDIYIRERLLARGIELLIIFILYNTKFRYFLNKAIMTYIGMKCGLILTIFILEMQFVGIVDFIFVMFPHEFVYTYAIIRLFQIYEKYKNTEMSKQRIKTILLKLYNYGYIIFLWTVALSSEIFLKNFMIKKFFIIKY